jgi:hypothetical protein
MRRAWLSAMTVAAVLSFASAASAAVSSVEQINGIGLIDYSQAPHFKVGDWVRYHVTSSSEMGESDDYNVTVLIAGEERFWGEDCFWVETWTEPRDRPIRGVATLMSYDVFSDSFPNIRSQYYMRKSVEGTGDNGELIEQVVRRPSSTVRKRAWLYEGQDVAVDSLPADTVSLPIALFKCGRVRIQQGKGATLDHRDSSTYTEMREIRVSFVTREVPVTGIARETIEKSIRRRSWAIGHSQDSQKLNTMDRSLGEARLVAMGSGLASRILPPERQVSLKQQDAAAARQASAKPAAAKPSSTAKKPPAAKPKS